MLINPGDRVEVRRSRCGYTGPGEAVDIAYGTNWLVKVERDGKDTVILVRFQDMTPKGAGEGPKKWDAKTKKSRGKKQAT